MKTTRIIVQMWLLTAFITLLSCGGGGGGSASTSGGGIGGSGIISHGAITEFGSIVVNGTEFDTSTAVVVVDGEEMGTGDMVVQDNLDRGRVVTVYAEEGDQEDSVIADRVVYQSNARGPVSDVTEIDTATIQLTVMGQTIVVNQLTHLKNTAPDEISPDDVVEVSGFHDDEGVIWASFLEKTGSFTSDLIYEVSGFVNSLDVHAQTFQINELIVDYSLADTGGLPGGLPTNDAYVEVEGTIDAGFAHMNANRVVVDNDLASENAEEVEVTGFVTDADATTDVFVVGNQVVAVEEDVVFVDGVSSDIAPGVKIEAEGRLVDGILWAYEIEFWDPDQMEIEGLVTHIESIGGESSEFTVDDQVVITTAETEYEDGGLGDIELDVMVEIKGRLQGDVMVADKVSFESEEDI